jgi:phosphatidylserine/phosphatidylglycerophosphate/cardiolipin synthase-like enzyme
MSQRRTGSMTPESLKIYREHFTRGKPKSTMLDDKVGITMRIPTVDEYLNAGQRWIDELVFAVNQAFTQDLTEKQRNDMIYDRAKATSMRQYVHWVDSIDIPASNQAIKDRATIEMTIASLSGDDAVRAKYYETVQTYINDSVIALIGVPQVHPEEADQVKPRFENIIPLDPVAVFISLLYQKTQQIRQRP